MSKDVAPPSTIFLYDKGKRPMVESNMRVRQTDHDENEVSDGEFDDDVDLELVAKLKDKHAN